MKSSEKLIKLLSEWEGCKPTVYQDFGGLLTIGIGHLLTRSELTSGKIQTSKGPVKWEYGITKNQAFDILSDDLKETESAINNLVKVTLTQNQFDALVSFAVNVGIGAFRNSTLLKLLNSESSNSDYFFVPIQLRRWIRVNRVIVLGLANRRENEIRLWNGEI